MRREAATARMPTFLRSAAGLATLLGLLVTWGCGRSDRDAGSTPPQAAADVHAARTLVAELGARLQRVSLLAPRSVLVETIEKEYGDLVTPGLLQHWLRDPTSAPGRLTSSPWPDEILIRTIDAREGEPLVVVSGEVVERTSADPRGGASHRVPVRLELVKLGGQWRIASYREERGGHRPGDSATSRVGG